MPRSSQKIIFDGLTLPMNAPLPRGLERREARAKMSELKISANTEIDIDEFKQWITTLKNEGYSLDGARFRISQKGNLLKLNANKGKNTSEDKLVNTLNQLLNETQKKHLESQSISSNTPETSRATTLAAAEEKARVAEEKARVAEERARLAEERARLAEEQARLAEEQARANAARSALKGRVESNIKQLKEQQSRLGFFGKLGQLLSPNPLSKQLERQKILLNLINEGCTEDKIIQLQERINQFDSSRNFFTYFSIGANTALDKSLVEESLFSTHKEGDPSHSELASGSDHTIFQDTVLDSNGRITNITAEPNSVKSLKTSEQKSPDLITNYSSHNEETAGLTVIQETTVPASKPASAPPSYPAPSPHSPSTNQQVKNKAMTPSQMRELLAEVVRKSEEETIIEETTIEETMIEDLTDFYEIIEKQDTDINNTDNKTIDELKKLIKDCITNLHDEDEDPYALTRKTMNQATQKLNSLTDTNPSKTFYQSLLQDLKNKPGFKPSIPKELNSTANYRNEINSVRQQHSNAALSDESESIHTHKTLI